MSSSDTKYISVSSPSTCNMNKIHQNILMQPDFHPANWKRPPVLKRGFFSRLHDSQDSDSESLVQETQYQLKLQQRIRDDEELVGPGSDELENDSLEEDSLEELSLEEQEGAEYDTIRYTNGMHENDGRKQQPVDKYFSLRYNPNWKNTKEATEFSEAEKAHQAAEGSSLDSFYLHSSGSPEEKNREEIADGPQRVKENFVEKNKQTLGLRSEKITSYLQLHSKKQEVLQEQVNPKTMDEEPVQSVLPFQTVKVEPEDTWYLKQQQLKDHQNSSQRNKIKSNPSLKGRPFPRNDSQQPPGRPAEPKSWHHRHHQIPAYQAVPMQAVEQDDSSTLREWLRASPSVDPDNNTAEILDTRLKNFPNSRHFVSRDFTTSTNPFHPTLHKFNPAEVISPANTSEENKKYQHDSPHGLSPDQQHMYNHVTVQLFAGGDSTNGQAHPNQRNISSTAKANFQESVKDQLSLQHCKGDSYKRSSQSSVHSSPTAPRTTSQFAQSMEQHHQETTRLAEARFTDRHLLSLLPPRIPQAESGSDVVPENSAGNQVKISRSNSEGYLMQVEKQNQPKASKKLSHASYARNATENQTVYVSQKNPALPNKQMQSGSSPEPYSSKPSINLNVKLGGLGPDYEAIKEKKEKLKQQKEYAKQVKEHNMKSIALVQRLPTKPQVISSVSRQKALEYAKKIPRPKIFTRQTDKEVKEEKVLPQTLNGDSLPQIASLETLQNRHEKEKQVVAAFRTLHFL